MGLSALHDHKEVFPSFFAGNAGKYTYQCSCPVILRLQQFATDAFDLDAVDYLLKPISFERFLKAVNKVTNHMLPPEAFSVTNNRGFLYFRSARKMVKVFLEDIQYIESIKDYIKIFLTNQNSPLIVKQSLTTLEAMLPSSQFIRIHRSYIVSKIKITAYTAYDIEIGRPP